MHLVYSRSILLFFLGAGFFAVYAPGLHGPFLLDDYPNIVTNKLAAVDTLDGEGLRDTAFSLGDSLLVYWLSVLLLRRYVGNRQIHHLGERYENRPGAGGADRRCVRN